MLVRLLRELGENLPKDIKIFLGIFMLGMFLVHPLYAIGTIFGIMFYSVLIDFCLCTHSFINEFLYQ